MMMKNLCIERHSTLSSTNDRALERAREGASAGLVVVADVQTAGRGQRGAAWHSPSGKGLYASFLLRPPLSPERIQHITLASGVATVDVLDEAMPQAVALKWPNDLLLRSGAYRGAKVGGILVESAADIHRVHHVVVGIGLNLVGQPEQKVTRARALSCVGTPPTVDSLVPRLADALQAWVAILGHTTGIEDVHRAWEARALGMDEPVELWEEGRLKDATALEGLDVDGALRVRYSDGTVRRFMQGKLRLAAEKPWLSFPPRNEG